MAEVLVVGAGVGGLCAALMLASAGRSVEVVEAASQPGGKAGTVCLDGVEVDTGPSVLTLPGAFEEIFAAAGTRMEDHIQLRRLSPAFDYRYPDGARLLIHDTVEATLESVSSTLGSAAAGELSTFLKRSAEMWAISERRFIRRPVPGPRDMLSWQAWKELWTIAPFQKMQAMIQETVASPYLRLLLERYATYNGSDVRRAPAALNCIAHVELVGGGFGVEGGIHALIQALVRVAESKGVRFHYDTSVSHIGVSDGCVDTVEYGGSVHRYKTLVVNADVSVLYEGLLRRPRTLPPPSMSGWTGIFRARRGDPLLGIPRVPHTVLFPSDYNQEFADLFDRNQVPQDPTVYLCAQEACHGLQGWKDEEAVFVMANAPPNTRDTEMLKERVHARLLASGLMRPEDSLLWERGPAQLAARFGGGGAIYGGSSNSPFAAFLRPANRVSGIRGLYLASGSAHPGGGLPLCAWSGRLAAEAVIADT